MIELALLTLFTTFVVVILGSIFRWNCLRDISLAGVLLAAGLLVVPEQGVVHLLESTTFSLFVSAFLLGVVFLVLLSSKEENGAYFASLLLVSFGMVLASSANDLILMYLAIELVTVPFYTLITVQKTRSTIEAATKYFVVSIVASAFLLLGFALLALAGGTTKLGVPLEGSYLLLGFAAVLAGLGFKLGIWPFNFWIPDVYQGAPSRVAGLLAGASKKAGFAVFIHLSLVLGLSINSWSVLLAIIAALSMTIPNLIALSQTDPRRLLAYSIMAHAGFLLMGLVVIGPSTISALLVHAFAHAFLALGAFLVLGVFTKERAVTMNTLSGFGWRNPLLGVSLTLFLLGLAGIPLLSGFVSKLYLFYTIGKAGFVWLAVLAIVNSVISLYYYFRIIRVLYGEKTAGRALNVHGGTIIAVLICVFITIIVGVYPVPLLEIAVAAASSLF